MRLLRSADLAFEDFQNDCAPNYVILSHTWYKSQDEVTYQQMCAGPDTSKPGYHKIRECARVARDNGYEYLWVDTCCIDKSSSAELSEAINSMYFWYSEAVVCYAYLSDVHQVDSSAIPIEESKWFTRGWTLQELLAPKEVVFYTSDWKILGSKSTLKSQIHEITKIPFGALEGTPLSYFSVAQRMSWASKRVTTRIEDIAYSLMGIFDVNMPLLYGEREKAFQRLQHHILQNSNDQSLFAWKDESLDEGDHVGVLAPSPKQFEHSNNVTSIGSWARHDATTLNHNGLRLDVWLVPTDEHTIFVASLACSIGSSYHYSPGIYVKQFMSSTPWKRDYDSQVVRIRGDELVMLSNQQKSIGQRGTVLALQPHQLQHHYDPIPSDVAIFNVFWDFRACEGTNEGVNYLTGFPAASWNSQLAIITGGHGPGAHGAVFVQHQTTSTLTIFGFSLCGDPWVRVFCPPPFAPSQWMMFTPDGSETHESEAVISTSPSRTLLCKAAIWLGYTEFGREMFNTRVHGVKVRGPAIMAPGKVETKKTEFEVIARGQQWWR